MSRASSDGMATTSVGAKVQQLFEQTKYLLIFFKKYKLFKIVVGVKE
jgi:hypothetical protein